MENLFGRIYWMVVHKVLVDLAAYKKSKEEII